MRSPDWQATASITYKWARRIAVGIIGGTVVLIGIAMIVLPGPALVVIPVGLGILGLEFAWARRWLARVKEQAEDLVNGVRDGVRNARLWRNPKPGREPPPGPPPVD